MNTRLKILRAGNGDSLLLTFIGNDGANKNILIDGGNSKSTYNTCLKSEILNLQNQNEYIDLLIITHTDQDHVKGIQYLLNDEEINKNIIKKIWFNSFDNSDAQDTGDISYIESFRIQTLIKGFQISRESNILIDNKFDFFGATITLLSPAKDDLDKLIIKNSVDISSRGNDYNFTIEELIENNSKIFIDGEDDLDSTIENRVSIAFLLEIKDVSILHLGDANPDIIENSIKNILNERQSERLKVNVVKLSHHASHRSLSLELIELIESNYFIVSTNGKKADLPNKLTFSKILNRSQKNNQTDYFIFNYEDVINNLNFLNNEMEKYLFCCLPPNDVNGYILEL